MNIGIIILVWDIQKYMRLKINNDEKSFINSIINY